MTSSFEEEYESSISHDSHDMWVSRFLSQGEHKGLVEVEMSFLEDGFNLYGLSDIVKDFERSWAVLRDERSPKHPENEAALYYMVHQRFILTREGMDRVAARVAAKGYGRCARVSCDNFPFIPVGTSDYPGEDTVKLFCFQCSEIYRPSGPMSQLDGCAFGRTFAHLLTIVRPELFVKKEVETYVPRIFGFQIHQEQEPG
jgi:casein kinase II subunit beta